MKHHKSHSLDPSVEKLDLLFLRFAPQLHCLDWAETVKEYRRFLNLKKRYPSQLFMPSGAALQMWQAHILDTRRYRNDSERLFGRFIDHFPYLACESLAERREKHFSEQLYQELYTRHFSG
tara:strand:+ start:19289 stop:19651 length:363 start_codon:yes stop_codon:yes gene_type:complete